MKEEKYCYQFPHPAVASDCAVLAFDGKDIYVLLIERKNEPYKGCWAFPGGFMEINETAKNAAIRELQEETGLTIQHTQQLGAFSEVKRDPRERVVSIVYYSLMRYKADNVCGTDDASKAQWFNMNDIPKLAFDHEPILHKVKHTLKIKLLYELEDREYLEDIFNSEEINTIISIL